MLARGRFSDMGLPAWSGFAPVIRPAHLSRATSFHVSTRHAMCVVPERTFVNHARDKQAHLSRDTSFHACQHVMSCVSVTCQRELL